MSPARAPTTARSGALALTVVAVVVIAVALMFLVRAQPSPGPFDPRSSAPDGLRGLVLLLQRYGADVDSGGSVPTAGSGARVLVVGEALDDEQRDALNTFVAAGGIAVIADAQSAYQNSATGDPDAREVESTEEDFGGEINRSQPTRFQATVDAGVCTIDALAHLRGLAIERPVAFAVPDTSTACFGDAREAVVRAAPAGDGTVVTIGDSSLFTNRWLEFGDNPGLATALLAPTDDAEVTIVRGNGPRQTALPQAGGDDRLVDLVRPSVWMGLAQFAVAFVVLAVALGVRPGRVVDEPRPSPLEGSALVSATGNLMQRARHSARAAELLRYDVHRRLCARFGIATSAPLAELDAELVARGLAAPGEVVDALSGPAPTDTASLTALARRLDALAALADDQLARPTTRTER